MSDNSKIEWTDATWNPVRGCTKISDGCKNCYAYAFAERWRGIKGHPFEKGFDVVLVRDNLDIPIKWKRPRMIFVNSMSDLFHEKVPDEFIKKVIQVMLRARQHIYQVLTKRPERMRDFLQKNFPNMELHPHIWWGVSVENKKQGLPRIDTLRQTPAALRFLSCEPLLEDLGPMNLSFIDWIIVGGESGPNARPIKPEWVRSIRDQAEKRSIPFFFKQWGGRNKKAAGSELDGAYYKGVPAMSLP